jgi:hypothetical protein
VSDQRITQLTKLAQADVAANDVLPIVDIGSSITKKVEVKELFQAGANLADSSSIDLIKLNQASATKLGTTALADDAVITAANWQMTAASPMTLLRLPLIILKGAATSTAAVKLCKYLMAAHINKWWHPRQALQI